MANGNKDKGKKALLAIGGVAGVTALIVALTRPVKAAPPPEEIPPIITVILDEETRQALAAILGYQVTISNTVDTINGKLTTTNQTLANISTALGVAPPVEKRMLEPFKKENKTLEKGTPFAVYESKPGKGSLIWAIFDVNNPDTKLSFRIDDLVWEFNFNTLLTQGIQQPLFPGAWLSKADAITGHYCIVFSAGTLEGFAYEQRLIISITYLGIGTATLHEARGILWTYL